MLRRDKEESIRIYGLYEPKRKLVTTKKGRPTESYVSYIDGLISKVVKLSKIEAKAQQQKDWRDLVMYCLYRLIELEAISVIVHPNDDEI